MISGFVVDHRQVRRFGPRCRFLMNVSVFILVRPTRTRGRRDEMSIECNLLFPSCHRSCCVPFNKFVNNNSGGGSSSNEGHGVHN